MARRKLAKDVDGGYILCDQLSLVVFRGSIEVCVEVCEGATNYRTYDNLRRGVCCLPREEFGNEEGLTRAASEVPVVGGAGAGQGA